MFQKIEDKLRLKVLRDIQSTKEVIHVEPKQGLFNFRCYENAVEYARLNPDHKVIEVMYLESGPSAVLHYINQDPDGNYLETTLGFRADSVEYYKLREIPVADYPNIGWVFNTTLEYWTNTRLKWWHRLLGITRLV